MKASPFLFVLFGLAAAVHAQTVVPTLDQDGRKGEMARLAYQQAVSKFDAADANKDGRLVREEVSPYMAENFARYDKDGDGSISWDEYVGHKRWKKD